ncbi:MAG: hypothetical protein LBG27_00970 [Spirochaetaceae bacterium]|nr:hypothetical protein [Spirochaetaceae bacterium]
MILFKLRLYYNLALRFGQSFPAVILAGTLEACCTSFLAVIRGRYLDGDAGLGVIFNERRFLVAFPFVRSVPLWGNRKLIMEAVSKPPVAARKDLSCGHLRPKALGRPVTLF